MNEFLSSFIDVLDTENDVRMDTVLSDLEEWDSLSRVSFIAMVKTNYGIALNLLDIKNAKTVADLYEAVEGK